ncbi:MAG: hypothetical protein BJ554DRAFT_2512 [Olpidium bornovanus]|uniref:Uncharacterized protein n=1 Tax=Olpidium bornovanus TaxID=278681 RepID=A0A8H8A101_9FUNG|nr:MAG: hypothetical protein BJ554DRAFT_2512 [Olpidium bornovanus]
MVARLCRRFARNPPSGSPRCPPQKIRERALLVMPSLPEKHAAPA